MNHRINKFKSCPIAYGLTSKSIEIKPFDLILFNGDGFTSALIKYVETKQSKVKARYSHCGIAITRKMVKNILHNHSPEDDDDDILVVEMTSSGKLAGDKTINLLTGKYKTGVQVRSLDSLLLNYPGKIYHAPLNNNPFHYLEFLSRNGTTSFIKDNAISKLKIIQNYVLRNWNTKYQFNPLSLFASAIPYFRKLRKPDPNKKICSEIIAEIYILLDILPKRVNPKNVVPVDFIYDSDKDVPSNLFGSVTRIKILPE